MPKWTKEKFVIYLLYLGPKHKGWYNHSTHDFNINCIWQNSRKATIRWKRAAGRYTFRIHQLPLVHAEERDLRNSSSTQEKNALSLPAKVTKSGVLLEKRLLLEQFGLTNLFPHTNTLPSCQTSWACKEKKKKEKKNTCTITLGTNVTVGCEWWVAVKFRGSCPSGTQRRKICVLLNSIKTNVHLQTSSVASFPMGGGLWRSDWMFLLGLELRAGSLDINS